MPERASRQGLPRLQGVPGEELRRAARPDLVLVAEGDHFRPDAEASVDPCAFGPINEYFSRPLGRLGLPYQYRLPNCQQLGIVSLGTFLKRHGLSVRVFGNVFHVPEDREAFLEVLESGPSAVGISTSCLVRHESVERIAGWVRERSPSSKILLGGFNSERNPRIRDAGDVTVLGSGERSLLEALRALKSGRSLAGIPNLVFREEGRWVSTPRADNIPVEEVPAPEWDLLPIRPSLCYPIEASKGCRYACPFCSYADKGRQRLKPVGQVVSELRACRDGYGARLFRFVDANLTSWPERAAELCRGMIAAKLDVEWGCFARADDLLKMPALAGLMREAGCTSIFSGIESGSDLILRRMRKGYSRAEALEGVRTARDAGLLVHGNFIIGYPGETRETVEETLSFISGSELDTAAFTVLAVTEELERHAAAHPRETLGLKREGAAWSHGSMDHAEAREWVGRCIEAVCTRMDRPLVAPYGVFMYYLLGNGLSAGESLDYLRGFRDFLRAERRGDDALREDALGRIRARYSGMLAGMRRRLPSDKALAPGDAPVVY